MMTDTLTQMKNMLSPLNIYDLSDGSLITAELSAYAAGINLIKEKLDMLLAEGFVQTAEDFGLAQREKLLGLSAAGRTVSERRHNILSNLILIKGVWDRARVTDALTAAGFAGGITEDFGNQTVCLDFTDSQNTTLPALSAVSAAARTYFPAQLKIRSNLNPLSWDAAEAMNSIFAYWDSLNLTADILNN